MGVDRSDNEITEAEDIQKMGCIYITNGRKSHSVKDMHSSFPTSTRNLGVASTVNYSENR